MYNILSIGRASVFVMPCWNNVMVCDIEWVKDIQLKNATSHIGWTIVSLGDNRCDQGLLQSISGWSHHLFTTHASASSLMVYKCKIYYTKIGANTCYLSYLTQWLKCIVLEYDNITSWQLFCEMKLWQIMPFFFLLLEGVGVGCGTFAYVLL